MPELDGSRVLVVGASSGIGRATALELARRGARVALAARRLDRLEEAAREAKGVALACDVRDPAACESAVAGAVQSLGGLDALLYCAGVGRPAPIADIEPALWHEILETNFIGAAFITRAALPHLTRTRGRALYLSSISARETPPRPGMAPYVTSKAALEKLVEAWQVEHPELTFTRITVGDTPTEFAARWDPDSAARYIQQWAEQGYLVTPSTPEAVASQIADTLGAPPTPVVNLV